MATGSRRNSSDASRQLAKHAWRRKKMAIAAARK
jgi:hypothetical protein